MLEVRKAGGRPIQYRKHHAGPNLNLGVGGMVFEMFFRFVLIRFGETCKWLAWRKKLLYSKFSRNRRQSVLGSATQDSTRVWGFGDRGRGGRWAVIAQWVLGFLFR